MTPLNQAISEQKQEFFKDIERTGEKLKQEFQKLSEEAQKKIESKVQSSKFEAAYAFSVSKEDRMQTMKDVKDVRSNLWEKALKEANGDISVAYSFYDKLCSFP